MIDQIDGITRIKGRGKEAPREGFFRRKKEVHSEQPESGDDSVDISGEARDRASGKKRRSILDYLKE